MLKASRQIDNCYKCYIKKTEKVLFFLILKEKKRIIQKGNKGELRETNSQKIKKSESLLEISNFTKNNKFLKDFTKIKKNFGKFTKITNF